LSNLNGFPHQGQRVAFKCGAAFAFNAHGILLKKLFPTNQL
jgi:hypothetical protein